MTSSEDPFLHLPRAPQPWTHHWLLMWKRYSMKNRSRGHRLRYTKWWSRKLKARDNSLNIFEIVFNISFVVPMTISTIFVKILKTTRNGEIIQDFWSTCTCLEKQSVPWIHCIEHVFFALKTQFALKFFKSFLSAHSQRPQRQVVERAATNTKVWVYFAFNNKNNFSMSLGTQTRRRAKQLLHEAARPSHHAEFGNHLYAADSALAQGQTKLPSGCRCRSLSHFERGISRRIIGSRSGSLNWNISTGYT